MISYEKVNEISKRHAAFVEASGVVVLELLDGTQYPQSDVKWVFDYYGPTGMPSAEGLLREVEQSDIDELILDGSLFDVKVLDGEVILCHIGKP